MNDFTIDLKVEYYKRVNGVYSHIEGTKNFSVYHYENLVEMINLCKKILTENSPLVNFNFRRGLENNTYYRIYKNTTESFTYLIFKNLDGEDTYYIETVNKMGINKKIKEFCKNLFYLSVHKNINIYGNFNYAYHEVPNFETVYNALVRIDYINRAYYTKQELTETSIDIYNAIISEVTETDNSFINNYYELFENCKTDGDENIITVYNFMTALINMKVGA